MALDPTRADFEPPAGTQVGAYQLIKKLGSGAFSVVYLASSTQNLQAGADQLEVVLKLLRGPCGHDPIVFAEEVANLSKTCKAPLGARVVSVVKAWEEPSLGGCYCLAIKPWCNGGCLQDLITKQVHYDLDTRLRWALQVAETLYLLHTSPDIRLYHGDVVARNIGLYMEEGELVAVLLDLGVSVHNHPHGMTEALKAHSASVAPEMVLRKATTQKGGVKQPSVLFDHSADVWGWAVLLYALLSWSMARPGDGDDGRLWFEALPAKPVASWEHELSGAKQQASSPEQWRELMGLMINCLRGRAMRASMRLVVHTMRRVLGYPDVASEQVWLEQKLRANTHQPGGGMPAAEEVGLLLRKANAHRRSQEFTDQHVALERAVELAAAPTFMDPALRAKAINDLAMLYMNRGQYGLALPLLQEALQLRRQVLPAEHADIATSLSNLAGAHANLHDLAHAVELCGEALGIRRSILPSTDPAIATSLSLMASLHQKRGEFALALPLFTELLARARESSSEKASQLADCLNNLAGLHERMGELELAKPLFQEALDVNRSRLPVGHPDIAMSLGNLAGLLDSQGEYELALPMYEEAVDISRKALPAGHPDIAGYINNLAALRQARGELDEALDLFQEALEMMKDAFGPDHPSVATCLGNLAGVHESMGQLSTALPLYQQALHIMKTALPPHHPDVATSLNNLAFVYDSLGDDDTAQPLYEQALATCRAGLPVDHPLTAACLNNLSMLYQRRGNFAAATSLCAEGLAIMRQALPDDHPDILVCRKNLDGLTKQAAMSNSKATPA